MKKHPDGLRRVVRVEQPLHGKPAPEDPRLRIFHDGKPPPGWHFDTCPEEGEVLPAHLDNGLKGCEGCPSWGQECQARWIHRPSLFNSSS